MKRGSSRITIRVDADLRPGHGLTHDAIYQAVVETLTAWVADERHNTLNPKDLPAEGHHTLIESRQLVDPERYDVFPTAMDEHRHRWTQRQPRYASSP